MRKKKTVRKRSPTYPTIGLQEAIKKVGKLYEKDKRNNVPRELAVNAMGYNSLSGRALQILSTLFQYGLLERSKGSVRISDDAFTILNAPENSFDKKQALRRVALAPPVFKDILNEYPNNLPSDENIKWFLQQRELSAQAANTTIQAFRETISVADVYGKGYNEADESINIEQNMDESATGENMQNAANTGLMVEKMAFPFGEKTAILSITGGKPNQDEMQLLIDILTAVKKTLPQKKKEEEK